MLYTESLLRKRQEFIDKARKPTGFSKPPNKLSQDLKISSGINHISEESKERKRQWQAEVPKKPKD